MRVYPFYKPLWGAQLDLDHPHSVNLVACFRLAEHWTGGDDGSGFTAGVVLDESQFRNHATLSNTAKPNNEGSHLGPVRGWLRAGGSQMISVPNRAEYEINGTTRTTFSMEAMVSPHSGVPASGVGIAFCYGDAGLDSGVTDQGYGMGVVPATNRIFARAGTVGVNTTNGAITCDNFTWSSIVFTYDGANIRRYVNGKLIGTTAKAGYTSLTGQNLGIGNTPSGSSSARAWRGRIAHARLWVNRVLDQQTIEELALSPYAAWMGDIASRHAWFFMAGSPIVVGSATIDMRANIKGKQTDSLQMRGNIRGVQVQTVDMRARILGLPPTIQMRTNIAEPETVPDRIIESWEVIDNLTEFSRAFSLSATEVNNFQVGNEVRITAGYDENRLSMIDGIIDSSNLQQTTENKKLAVSGRDIGARELGALRITYTWKCTPPKVQPTAHGIITDAAAQAGLSIGVLEFPDYKLFQPYVAIGRTVLEIVSELVEPYNQFARVQHVTEVRDRMLSIRKIDFQNPPTNGYQLTLEEHFTHNRLQRLYLDEPRLNEVEAFEIRGASWDTPKLDLGTTTEIEFYRTVATAEVEHSIAGVVQGPDDQTVVTTNSAITKEVTTEETIVSLKYGDKVLRSTHTITINDEMSSRTIERYWYFEPGENVQIVAGDVNLVSQQSQTPSSAALLWMVHSKRSGIVERSGVTVFDEVFRSVTQYHYNNKHEVGLEVNTTQEFNEDTHRWEVTSHSTRTHSQITGGNVRTTLLNFIFEDSKFKIGSADTQNVGGTKPKPNAPASKKDVITHQAQTPQGEVDALGNPIEFGQNHFLWSFESPYMGQDVCDAIYQETLNERTFQLQGYRWEELQFDGILNPNIRSGQPISVEITEGEFVAYWLVDVTHQFGTSQASTSGTAKRLTLEEL